MTRLVTIDHVQLAMPPGPGAERSAEAFYGALLGLTRVVKPAALAARGGCWFEGPNVRVHLGVDPDFRPARRAHPAFVVADLGGLIVELEAHGHRFREDHELVGVYRGYVDDPFGNRIELIARFGTEIPV